MTFLRIALAVVHLLALAIGFGAVSARAWALGSRPLDVAAARRAMTADAWWGIAALLWIASGVWRLLAGTEKATDFYLHNHVFFAKMGLFALIFVLEIWPMMVLGRWRKAMRRGGADWNVDGSIARRIRAISMFQALLLIAIVTAAVMLARGVGA